MLELLRQCRRRSATRLGVAFASLWLAFAAVPCSALEQFGVDLGHAHAAPVATAADQECPHCPPEQTAASTMGDCIGLDDALVAKLGTLDLTLAAAPQLPMLVPAFAFDRRIAPVRDEPQRPPAVPLNLRYCTFLE